MEAPLAIGIISAVAFFPGIAIALLRDDKKYISFIKDLVGYWLYCFHLIPLFFMTIFTMITKSNRRHLLANKTTRQKKSGKIQDAYVDKTCEKGIKKLLPYGNN